MLPEFPSEETKNKKGRPPSQKVAGLFMLQMNYGAIWSTTGAPDGVVITAVPEGEPVKDLEPFGAL